MAGVCAGSALVQAVIIGRQDNWNTLYDLAPTYEAYMETWPRRERHDTARRQRRLHEAHEVVVAEAATPQEVREGMDAVVALHQKLWNGKGKAGHFGGSPSQALFHREVAERMLKNGHLALLTMRRRRADRWGGVWVPLRAADTRIDSGLL